MNRPLHTNLKLVFAKFTLLVFLLVFSSGIISGQTFGTDECNCLDNATQSGDGQFSETFIVNSAGPGETWTIESATNFFDPGTSTPGNPVPFIFPAPMTDNGGGNYTIDGIRVEGGPWSIVVSDGMTTFPYSSQYICSYPDSTIYGDPGSCIGNSDIYHVDIPDSDLISIMWSLPAGGGTIITPADENNVEIEWGVITGTYQLQVDVVANPPGGPVSAADCMFSTTIDVDITDEAIPFMACNNELQLSLSGLCGLEVTPSMFMEAMEYPETSYDVIIKDLEADTIVDGTMLNNDYVDKLLEVTIRHECSFNSCWGYLKLEDKAAPPLNCNPPVDIDCDMLDDPTVTGFPLPPSAIVTQIGNKEYLVQNYDPCGDATLTFIDSQVDGLCSGPYSAIITRTWYITDEAGNQGSCESTININRALFADIVYPENYDDITGTQPSLEACGGWETTVEGAPAPSVTGYPMGVECINATVEFQDVFLEKCSPENIENTFKVLRRWRVIDHCTSQDSIHIQYISVLDRTDPVINVPDQVIVNTDDHSCAAQIKVPVPEVEECSIWDYAISYQFKDENGNPIGNPSIEGIWRHPDGSYIIEDIDADQEEIWILYSVYDVCGNVAEESTEIVIVDNQEPVPVCDQYSYVALNEEGIAWAGPATFDDGSWDNCGIEKMEVRRMEASACGVTSTWSDKVKFCCNDIGTTVMVQLRVTDHAGNSNACMVEVEVQDNHAPVWTFCPDDQEVDCDTNLGDYSQFGMATATDNCSATVTVVNTPRLNSCGLGVIDRVFTATDDEGNSISKVQTITVVNQDLFTSANIDWPDDIVLPNGCINGGTDPENLPPGFDYPDLVESSCSEAIYDYEDLEFQYVEGACLKIIRRWTVIDWCQFDPKDPSKGKYYHNQVIKVLNSEAPVIIEGCSGVQNTEQLDGCSVIATLFARAEDDCTPEDELIWRYELDFNNDGSINKFGSDNDASTILPVGTHKITWYVKDECGNQSSCNNVFTINDEKQPTPVCLEGIVSVIMDRSGSVTIWAKDFDKGSYDNCGYNHDVVISFSADTTDIFRTFTCEDLNGMTKDTFELRMYVTDQVGNNDFCTTTIIVQDNKNSCGNAVEEEVSAKIAGAVYSESNEMVSDVEVSLMTDSPEFPVSMMTGNDGAYAFNDLAMYRDYVVSPEKKGSYLEGVSTLDIVLIQRHILGIEELDSPYKIIAGDVNNSAKVSAADIIQLRKLILGIYEELPDNESWRFIDKSYTFDDISRPFPFDESTELNQVDKDVDAADFVAVKVGDVNGSVAYNGRSTETNNRSSFRLTYDTKRKAGQSKITFHNPSGEALVGFQLAINIPGIDRNDIQIISEAVNIDPSQYLIDDEMIAISYSATEAVITDGGLFSIVIKEKMTQGISLSAYLNPEIYVEQGAEVSAYDVELQLNDISDELVLLQNTPNPFNDMTTIGFILPQDNQVTLRIMDINGRVVKIQKEFFKAGQNSIIIDATDIDAQGILYYQLETQHHSLTRKMILIK